MEENKTPLKNGASRKKIVPPTPEDICASILMKMSPGPALLKGTGEARSLAGPPSTGSSGAKEERPKRESKKPAAKEVKEAKKGQTKRARDRYSHWRSHSPVPATLGPLLFGTPDYCALPLQPGRRRHRG